MEVLSHDVVEDILERLPVKSLVRFKFVSKRWKSTIESKYFQERHLVVRRRHQSTNPDILFLTRPISDSYYDTTDDIPLSSSSSSLSFSVDDDDDDIKIISSSRVTLFKSHTKKWFRCTTSCDGLVCIYNLHENILINPATRWHRKLPLSNLQQQGKYYKYLMHTGLGFGKDKVNGTYKPVLLYNNTRVFGFLEDSKEKTCEVFDFSTNAWRYVTPPSSCHTILYIKPVDLDGSLHWLTNCESKTQLLSFDLHTETFQVIAKAPFDLVAAFRYMMCNVNNSLCVSKTKWPIQMIWLFDSSNKTWNHMHSIDLKMTYSWFKHEINRKSENGIWALAPLAILEEKKVLFSFHIHEESSHLVIYDGQTDSYELAFTFNQFGWCPENNTNYFGSPLSYFQSLISIL